MTSSNAHYLNAKDHQALGEEARQPWREHAACRNRPDLIRGGPGAEQRRKICFGCPVLTDCRDWAMTLPPGADTDDIAGGMTVGQRIAARKRITQLKAADTAEAPETTGGPVTVHALNPKAAEEPADTPSGEASEPVGIVGLEQLLRRAEQSENAATRRAGQKTREAVEDLRQRVNAEAAEARVRAEIAELEKQLAAKREKLGEIRPAKKATKPRPSVPDGVSARDVRTWAKERGIACPANGRIPQHVTDQYMAAIK